MSARSRTSSWLSSLYRRVLRRGRRRSPLFPPVEFPWRHRRIDRDALEALEARTMLSTTNFANTTLASYTANPIITAAAASAIENGLNQVASLLDELNNSQAFNTKIPGLLHNQIGQPARAPSLVEQLPGTSLGDLFASNVSNAINFNSGTFIGQPASAIVTALDGLDTTVSGVVIDVDASTGDLISIGGNDYELEFTLTVSVSDEDGNVYDFDLGRNADQFGISTPAISGFLMPDVDVTADLTATLDFGVVLTVQQVDLPNPPDDDATVDDLTVEAEDSDFFIRDASISASAHINEAALSAIPAMSVGFIDVTGNNGTFVLDGGISAASNDGGDNRISLSELTAPGAFASIFPTFTPNGTISASLTLNVTSPGADNTFGGEFSGLTLTIGFDGTPFDATTASVVGSGDPRTAPHITTSADFTSFLLPFKNIDSSDIIGNLDQIGQSLNKLPGSDVLNLPIPFAKNKTVGQLFNLLDSVRKVLLFDGTQATDAAKQKLVDSNGNPLFDSIQELVDRLDAILPELTGFSVDPEFDQTNKELTFKVKFEAPIPDLTLPIAFNLPLGALGGFSSDATVVLDPNATLEFTFGVQFQTDTTQVATVGPPVYAPRLIAVPDATGAARTDPTPGADVKFKLTLGNVGTIDVTVPLTATSGNGNNNDLVGDIQSAINAAITAANLTASGGGPATVNVGLTTDGRLTISSPHTGFLRIEPISGDTLTLTALGFLPNQVSSIAPTPQNGILTNDLSFTLTVGGAGAPTVQPITVTKAAILTAVTAVDPEADGFNIGVLATAINSAIAAAGITGVTAMRAGGNGDGIILTSTTASFLQLSALNAVALEQLGWQEGRISGRLSIGGKDEIRVTSDALDDSDAAPASSVSFAVIINGESVVVTAPQSSFSGNATLADLVTDLNLAIANADMANGMSLGNFVAAATVDTDGNGVNDAIVIRATNGVTSLAVAPGGAAGNAGLVGFGTARDGVRLGAPLNGIIGGATLEDATFTVTLNDAAPVVVTVEHDETDDNNSASDPIAALVQDINDAIAGTTLNGQIRAGRAGNRIILVPVASTVSQIRVNLDPTVGNGQRARDQLGLDDGMIARVDQTIKFFIDNAGLDIGASLTAEDITAQAQFAFVGIEVAGGAGTDGELSIEFVTDVRDGATGSSRVYIDTISDRFIRASVKTNAGISPVLSGDLEFDLFVEVATAGGTDSATVHVLVEPDGENDELKDLAGDIAAAINAALASTDLEVTIKATVENNRIVIAASALEASQIKITNPNSVATGIGLEADEIGSTVITVPDIVWEGDLALKGISVTGIPGLDITDREVSIHVQNGSPTAVAIPDFSGLGELLNFENLDFGDLLSSLSSIADFLTNTFSSFDFLSDKLPVINRSFDDLLTAAERFQEIVQTFTDSPGGLLQELEDRLIEALGLPSTSGSDGSGLVTVAYDSASHTLTAILNFSEVFNKALPVDFDISQFVGDFPFELKGAAGLATTGGANVKLGIGLDLSNPTSPEPFLDLNNTDLSVSFSARGKDLTFTAALGPAGLFVNDGFVAIDADGDANTADELTLGLTLVDPTDSDGRVGLDDLDDLLDSLDVDLQGALGAQLPLFFPTESDFLGNLGISIPSIVNFLEDPSAPGAIEFEIPDLSNILENLSFNLFDNLRLLIDGLDFFLGQLQDILTDKFGSVDIPLVGDQVGDAATFIQDFRDDVLGTLRDIIDGTVLNNDPETAATMLAGNPALMALASGPAQFVQDALFKVFGPEGLGILRDFDDPSQEGDLDDIHVSESITGDFDTDFVQWDMNLGDRYEVFQDIGFDIGLPALGLEADGDIGIAFEWGIDFGFGLNFDDGFYFSLNEDENDAEVEAGLEVFLPDSLTGNLLFLALQITNEDGSNPSLTGDLSINLADGSSDEGDGDTQRLNLTEFPDIEADFAVGAAIDLDLGLAATVALPGDKDFGVLPTIRADFVLDWVFEATTGEQGDINNGLQLVAFNNVRLDLGSFFSDFLGPVLSGIQDITGPIQPLIDVLTAPIPVISDLAGEPFTLIDLAALFGDINPDLIEALADIITLVNSIPDPAEVGGIQIPLGSLVLVDNTGMSLMASGFDLFNAGGLDAVRDGNTDLGTLPGFGDVINNFNLDTALGGAMTEQGLSQKDADLTKKLAEGGFGQYLSFPFLENPSSILGLLFGRPVDLIVLDLPPLSFNFEYFQFFPIIGPLGAQIGGGLGATIDFAFGYDTFGFQKFAEGGFKHAIDIFRGFYISDTDIPTGTGGTDVAEITLTGNIQGSAVLNLGVAKGGVGGGIFVTIGFNLNDPNNDGKVRIEELLNNLFIADFNPFGVFDFDALIEAKLTWFIEVLFVFKASGQIGPSLPLYQDSFSLDRPPVLATDVGDGVLRLNTGKFASDRLHRTTTDVPENFTITKDGGDIVVSAFGEEQRYGGITRIEADLGQGNDVLTINVDDPNLVVDVDGGFGDDKIDAANFTGTLVARAGSGADTVIGGSGADTISGDVGADVLYGGAGSDRITAGDDADTVCGDEGDDTIFGDGGADLLAGGEDNDYIDGGGGADTIYGDSCFDIADNYAVVPPAGNEGSDTLSGGDGDDIVRGEGNDDFLAGGARVDLIEGGEGSDKIWGDSALPEAFDGSDENATPTGPIPSEEGGDTIYGRTATSTNTDADGDDCIFGEGKNDSIRGNAGDDSVEGAFGQDTIFGDAGEDTLQGQSDGDFVFGGANDDTVVGGAGNDVLFGDDGLIASLDGVAGQSAGDTFVGDGDPATLLTGTGDGDPLSRDLYVSDIKTGAFPDGDDNIDGNAGDDFIFGGAGNDVISGDIDPEEIDAFLANPQNANTPTGIDVMFGDSGRVELTQRRFTRFVTTEPTQGGNDIVYGNNGDDFAFGGVGDDQLNGGHGPTHVTTASDKDILIGDQGEVTFFHVRRESDNFITGSLVDVIQTTDTTNSATVGVAVGGEDIISGNEDNDIALGGVQGDTVGGHTGTDILLGDEGEIRYTVEPTDSFDGDLVGDGFGDEDRTTIDLIRTTDPDLGGDDVMQGNEDGDTMFGGTAGDEVYGDAELLADRVGDADGNDIGFGDHGLVGLRDGSVLRVRSTDTDAGGNDTVTGNAGLDTLVGGFGDDHVHGDAPDPVGNVDGDDVGLGDGAQIDYDLDDDPSTIDVVKTIDPANGGEDVMSGDAGSDILLGGAQGDEIHGDNPTADSQDGAGTGSLDGGDILLGDHGLLSWIYGGTPGLAIETGFTLNPSAVDLDLITTTDPTFGDEDEIYGNAGDDIAFGGTDHDLLIGDNAQTGGVASEVPGHDVLLGDHGRLYPTESALPTLHSRNFFAIDVGHDKGGAGDSIYGNEGHDLLMGQQGDDLLFGQAGDDDLIGGHNVIASRTVGGDAKSVDELQTLVPDAVNDRVHVNDLMDGGTGNDVLAGDNAEIWRNGGALPNAFANDIRLRFRQLGASGLMYNVDSVAGNYTANVTGLAQQDPRGVAARSVVLLDHSASIETTDSQPGNVTGSRFGNDIMAGDQGHDLLFGQLGDDMMQGDGNIDEASLDIQVFEGTAGGVVTDGDDYLEGNGGSDLLVGNLGQDDIIGGSSDLFGLAGAGSLRPDAGDIIFGGAALSERVKRLAFVGDATGDTVVFGGTDLNRRYALDADIILGDNGRIFRLVNGSNQFLQFNYDQTVVGVENRGTIRVVPRAIDRIDYSPIPGDASTIGAADIIHGESGDDSIHGMTGDDFLYGDSDDDDIFGEVGLDWISGGTGRDGVLGDDGLIPTSRHGTAEPIYGKAATVQQLLATPGNALITVLNPLNVLTKGADLEPFSVGSDDVIYGGLGDDSLHGGFGNDGISGGEALAEFYYDPASTPRVEIGTVDGDPGRIVPRDNGVIRQNFYDFTNALAKLGGHFLNFENVHTPTGRQDPQKGDGHDVLFGDEGHDWLVGGSGRDHFYAGAGDDIINGDDDLETNGGLNDVPEGNSFTPMENSDTAYGGSGRDLLLGNTGADRMNDWVGEFNSYQFPFAPFGIPEAQRQVAPFVPEFFYAMAKSDGADQTRIGVNGSSAIRNGEPYGELSLVLQQDGGPGPTWAQQTGAPIDRQAGNTPGGKVDTRGDALNGGGGTNVLRNDDGTTVVLFPTEEEIVQAALDYFAVLLTSVTPSEFVVDLQEIGDLSLNTTSVFVLHFDPLSREFSWSVVF